jgi:hypothetical protein
MSAALKLVENVDPGLVQLQNLEAVEDLERKLTEIAIRLDELLPLEEVSDDPMATLTARVNGLDRRIAYLELHMRRGFKFPVTVIANEPPEHPVVRKAWQNVFDKLTARLDQLNVRVDQCTADYATLTEGVDGSTIRERLRPSTSPSRTKRTNARGKGATSACCAIGSKVSGIASPTPLQKYARNGAR